MMNNMTRRALLSGALALILAVRSIGAVARESAPPEPAADEKTGPKVGEKAPEFTLTDQNGKQVSLAGLLEKSGVALVFYRSAGWCPFCRKQLVQLQEDLKRIESDGDIRVVAVSYDKPGILSRFAEKEGITFPLLSDEGSKVIDAFGIRNPEAKGMSEGIPYPGTYVIDRKGVIRAKLFLDDYKLRHTADALIEAAKRAAE